MSVDLSKNGGALRAAYEQVVDAKSHTNWALFTYEGNSNSIRLAQTGEGGLDEMVEELSSGKVMYAFCRVQDPNSGLPKYVLVNWTGEGVKDSRKGICANHVSSMARFLKGAHVTINARAEEDVEPEAILAKVAKASGANYNFHKPSEYRDAPRAAVGSVYCKVNAMEEIQRTKKDDFWDQAQRDEELRQQEEKQRAELERQKLEKERMEMEERQAKERERRAKERAQQIEQQRMYEKQRQEEEESVRKQQLQNQQDQDNMKRSINSAASVQKANEAKALISQRSFNPRDVFKQREASLEASEGPSPTASRPGKLQSPFLSQTSFDREAPVSPGPAEAEAPLSWRTHLSPSPPEGVYQTPAAAQSPAEPADAAPTDDSEWLDDDGGEADPENDAAQDHLYDAPGFVSRDESLYQNIDTAGAGDDPNGKQENICAVALYDYQAADDTEITFDPDDIITGIEMVDEGWWRGFTPDGHYGLFPANYVELL